MTSENTTWDSLKNEYLHQIEKTLASVRHPRSKEVVQDVCSHLDRRFADLDPEEQTCENFQAIITEMGPASDYAELLEPGAAPLCRSAWRKHALWVGLATTIVGAAAILLLVTRKTFPETLNEAQTLYKYWTETHFDSFLNRDQHADLAEPTRKQLEEKWLKMLERAGGPEYYNAINSLAAIRSKRALKPLLEIATDRREKDNRDRWMATKALGIVGDESIVPELIHLVYHYNQNTRFWAQISLVRLTGVNFGSDWQAWGQWWNRKNGNPPFSPERITWTSRADWADEGFQQETDKAFVERQKQTENQPEQSSVETYIIKFKSVGPFEPQTSRELLEAFNENHPRDVRTHHYRTEVRDNSLIGFICVDTKAGRDAIVTMLQESEKLKALEANLATAESLQVLYQMGQPSPKESPSQMTHRALSVSANRKLLDEQTLTELTRHEQLSAAWFKVEEGYEAASADEKKEMIKQWITDATGDDFDKMTRAIAALGNVAAREALDVLMNIAQKPKRGNRPRWMATRALGRIGDMAAVPLLINLLDHCNSDTRLYAKVALAEITGIYFGDSKEKWSDWARKQGIEVKQMDVGQRQTASTQSRTYPKRPPRSRYQTVSRTGNWPAGNCSVGGTVYREAGYGSVEHARVCLSSAEFGSWVVATDYGQFDFNHIPAGVYTLRTTDTFGYKETSYNPENKPGESPSFRLKDGEERWQIRLKVEPVRPYLHVSGRILDEAGNPITNNQDLHVDAWLQLPQGHLKGYYRPVASSGVSQQDGSYLLRELDGRPIYVMVRDLNACQKDNPYPPRYYPGTFSRGDAKMINFDNHESLENADIRLARRGGVALQGMVTDESTGEPVPNAMVVIRHADMLYDLFPGYTDEKGNYCIEGLGDGGFLAYADAMYKGFVKTRKFFTIRPGAKETRLDITLSRGARISGKFVDEDGHPWQVERAHGSTSVPGAPYVGNASNFPYRNKYGPSVVWATTVFYNQGEGDQPSSMMVYPTRDTFLIEAMMPGEARIQFSPRDPRGRVLEILHNGKNIKNELVSTEPGQELKDVTIVVGASGGGREQRAQTNDRLQFALYDAFGREVHSQDYKGVPIFLEFGACW